MKAMKLKDQSKMLLSHILRNNKDVKDFYDIDRSLVYALMVMQGGRVERYEEVKTLVNEFIKEKGVTL